MDDNRKKEDTFEELGFVRDECGSYHFDELEIGPPPVPALSTDVPSSRLVITHLTVKNFKSYAGEQVIGPFDKNFTAVVGPNGSGKSNVIDALMFVFGKKSKEIRAKKVQFLIHKSEKFPDIKSCSVSVNFAMITSEDGKGAKIVDGSGLIVCRIATDDGNSHYEMNHQRVHHKDVVRTLRNYGIDMEYNRFLIMQGEIESISLMQPKAAPPKEPIGMLEYIEDIVGSHRLIEPIQYFQEKVNELSTEESEKGKEVELYEKEKNELQKPKDNAIAYLRLENKRVLCENSIFHAQRKKVTKELEDITEEKNKFLQEVKSLKAEMAEVQKSKKALESDLAEVAAKHDSILKKREEYDGEFRALIRQDAANLEDIKHIKGKIQSAKKGMEDSQSEIKKLTKQLTVYEKETDELQIKKKKLEEEKSVEEKKATQVMGTLKEETEKMQERKDVKEAELIKLKENMYQVKSEMDLIKSELNICVSGDKKEKEALSTLQSDYKNNQENEKNEEALVQQEASRVKELEKELSSLKEQLSQAKEKELSLLQQNRDARQKWEEARTSQQSNRNNSSLLQALLKAKSAGKLPPGIYGRLGDLGAIDEKYDVAISTCCGRLDQIVTDCDATAQECIKYMKRNNLGYMTFIALDRVTKQMRGNEFQKVATPENIPRLIDLIRVNDRAFLPAFYLGLHETLVADNLEQATRIGLGGPVRRRVVTLNGELVEATGAMIGGGRQVIRGKMGQKVVANAYSEQELAEMSAEVRALSQELLEIKQLCVSLDDKIAQGTNQLASLHHSLKKRSLRCNAFKDKTKMITSQIKEQQKKVQESTVDEEKVSELEEKIKKKNKIYTKAVQETSVVETEVSELQAKILEVTKGKYSKAKKTVDQLKKKLDEVTQAITKSTVNMKQSKSKVKKLETKLSILESELASNEKELQILKQKQSELTDRGQKTSELVRQHNDELGEFVEKQKLLKKEVSVINEQEHKLKQVEIEHKNKLKSYEADEAEKRAYIKSFNSKLGKLKLAEVEKDSTEIPTLSDEDISKLNLQTLQKDLDIIKAQLEEMKPDLSSIDEFKRREEHYLSKLKEYNEIKAERLLQDRRRRFLYKQRVTEFMKAFAIITVKVKEIYQMLTNGGDAELDVAVRKDPFAGGILYSVRPPKKSWKSMSHLSGGEKTLSSLALVFSLHYYRATPFYVMDEIDAALDETNVGIIGKYLLVQQKNAQFVIVSLRNVMNELPDHLLGVHKIDNCTRHIHLSHCVDWKGTKRPQEAAPEKKQASKN